ncbi:hypothetical protein SEA_TRUCKEE_18 [Arthrobacter phage Truckee]|nr:hypothetical protein SEA_TRUCKEE_18 [Arthrobacter phage Truckee]
MARTATLTIDTTKVTPQAIAKIESILYGSDTASPRLPLPGEIKAIIDGTFLVEDPVDPGFFLIAGDAMTEDPDDPGFFIIHDNISEDPAEPGTYISGD